MLTTKCRKCGSTSEIKECCGLEFVELTYTPDLPRNYSAVFVETEETPGVDKEEAQRVKIPSRTKLQAKIGELEDRNKRLKMTIKQQILKMMELEKDLEDSEVRREELGDILYEIKSSIEGF